MPWLDKKYVEMIEYVKQRKEVSYMEIVSVFKIPPSTAIRRLRNICMALERRYVNGKCIDTSQT